MRLAILILSLAVPVAAAAAPPAALPKTPGKCPSDRVVFADRDGKVEAKRLGELPPGSLYLSVDRQVDGCRQPVIVRYGIGAVGGAPARR
jgi:hypothetical protein